MLCVDLIDRGDDTFLVLSVEGVQRLKALAALMGVPEVDAMNAMFAVHKVAFVVEDVFVTPHAVARLTADYPRIRVDDVWEMIAHAREVAPAMAAVLLNRKAIEVKDRYLVSADRNGLFVIRRSPEMPKPLTCVTWVSFSEAQRKAAKIVWQEGR